MIRHRINLNSIPHSGSVWFIIGGEGWKNPILHLDARIMGRTMASKEQGIIQSGKDHPEASGGRSRKLNPLQELHLHSIFFSLYPILHLFARNIMFTPMGDMLRSMGVSLGLTTLFLLAFYSILRDWARASAICSLILFLFYTFGHCAIIIEAWTVVRSLSVPIFTLAGLWGGALPPDFVLAGAILCIPDHDPVSEYHQHRANFVSPSDHRVCGDFAQAQNGIPG